VYVYWPLTRLTGVEPTSTTVPVGFLVVKTTLVLRVGVGVTVPDSVMLAEPENEVPLAATVTADAAKTAAGASTRKAARMTVARVDRVFIFVHRVTRASPRQFVL